MLERQILILQVFKHISDRKIMKFLLCEIAAAVRWWPFDRLDLRGRFQHILRENDDDTFEENGSTGQRSPGEPFKDLDQQQTQRRKLKTWFDKILLRSASTMDFCRAQRQLSLKMKFENWHVRYGFHVNFFIFSRKLILSGQQPYSCGRFLVLLFYTYLR